MIKSIVGNNFPVKKIVVLSLVCMSLSELPFSTLLFSLNYQSYRKMVQICFVGNSMQFNVVYKVFLLEPINFSDIQGKLRKTHLNTLPPLRTLTYRDFQYVVQGNPPHNSAKFQNYMICPFSLLLSRLQQLIKLTLQLLHEGFLHSATRWAKTFG